MVASNLKAENHTRFWCVNIYDLSGNQNNICGVFLKHLKHATSYEDPDDNLGQVRDIKVKVDVLPGNMDPPTNKEWLVIYFNL